MTEISVRTVSTCLWVFSIALFYLAAVIWLFRQAAAERKPKRISISMETIESLSKIMCDRQLLLASNGPCASEDARCNACRIRDFANAVLEEQQIKKDPSCKP